MVIEELFPPFGAFWDWTRAELWAAPSSSALPRLGPFFVLRPRLIQFPVWGGSRVRAAGASVPGVAPGRPLVTLRFPLVRDCLRSVWFPANVLQRTGNPLARDAILSHGDAAGGGWRFGPASGGLARVLEAALPP